jgi:acetyltransferase-like isoleucine patch superfamily enzyme
MEKNTLFCFNKGGTDDPFKSVLTMEEGSKLIVKGSFSIMTGARVLVGKDAIFEVGRGYINHNAFIVCRKKITIGNGATISNNVVIRDNDAHEILDEKYESVKSIEIGEHVWIGTNVTILKGVKIGNGAVIGANSLVNKDIPEKSLAAGVPTRVIKENIEWK